MTILTETKPLDLRDSLNHITIFTQPLYPYAAFLVNVNNNITLPMDMS